MRKERADVRRLQIFLALIEPHEHVRGDRERLLLARLGSLHERHDLGGKAAVQRDVLLEQRDDATRHRALIGAARRLVERERRDVRAQHLLRRRVARHLGARDAFDEHLGRAVGQSRHLQHAADDAHAKEIGCRGILGVRGALGDEEDPAVAGERRLHRRE